MTTNLNAVAGPSKFPELVKSEPTSPVDYQTPEGDGGGQLGAGNGNTGGGGNVGGGVGTPGGEGGLPDSTSGKPGVGVDENGEVIKVPAFLQKLYSMVSDPTTNDLIHWSDSGSSFFVPNHEQFGKELLPRFFKHANFSSFVRQLNMYGFHKVPHLQSGVLKNDAPFELWEFVNPCFKRDQQQLLSRVTRKTNRPGMLATQPVTAAVNGNRSSSRQTAATPSNQIGGQHHPMLLTDGTVDGEAGLLVRPTAGQMIDLSAITSGIAAIQRTQATIGADLKALQTSNEHLWREALESRERHRKHQETIDLIVSFLERLFGKEGEGVKGLAEALRRGAAMGRGRDDGGVDDPLGTGSRKRRRLGLDRMIGDGVVGTEVDVDDAGIWDGEDDLVEISTNPDRSNDPFGFALPIPPRISRPKSRQTIPATQGSSTTPDPWSSSSTSQRFTALPTEEENNSTTNSPFTPASAVSGQPGQPSMTGPDQTLAPGGISPLADHSILPGTNNVVAPYHYNFNQGIGNSQSSSNPGSLSGSASGGGSFGQSSGPMSPNSSAAAASAFNLDPAILQTTIGSLLQSPAAAQMFLNSLTASTQGQALQSPLKQSFNPDSTAASSLPSDSSYPFPTNGTELHNVDPSLEIFAPLENQQALVDNSNSLLRSYQDADAIGGDVDKLQESIDSLVRSMGLDLPGNGAGADGVSLGVGNGGGGLDDFNVDEFLEQLEKSGGDLNGGGIDGLNGGL